MKVLPKLFFHLLPFISVIILLFTNCNHSASNAKLREQETKLRRPPASVEKAWLARHHYDPERRLLIPRYSGARWGSILEFTEDETLVYRDWWIRDVKVEDLDAAPNTRLTPFSQIGAEPDDEGSDTPDEVPTGDAQSADSPLGSSDFASPDSEQPGDTDSPFAPVNQTDMLPTEDAPAFDPFSPVQ